MSLYNSWVFLTDFNCHSYFIHSDSAEDRKQIQVDPHTCGFSIRSLLSAVYHSLKKNLKNRRNKWFISFKMGTKWEQAITWWNPAAQTQPVLDSSSIVPIPTFPLQTCHHSASSVLTVRISCRVIAVFVFRKQQGEWRSQWIPTIGYFLTNNIFLLQVMYRYVSTYDFHCKTCNNKIFFSLLMLRFDGKAWFLLFCHPLKLYMTLYNTGTVFSHCSTDSCGLG